MHLALFTIQPKPILICSGIGAKHFPREIMSSSDEILSSHSEKFQDAFVGIFTECCISAHWGKTLTVLLSSFKVSRPSLKYTMHCCSTHCPSGFNTKAATGSHHSRCYHCNFSWATLGPPQQISLRLRPH